MREKRFRRSIAVAAILGTALSMSSFGCVYGPPPAQSSDVPSEISPSASEPEESFEPSNEIPQDVYGPQNPM